MRHFKLLGAVIVVVFALTGIATATASALPEFLPTGGTLTAKSGKAKLQVKGGAAIECSSSVTPKSGTIGTNSVTVKVEFKGCKTLGVAVETEGLKTAEQINAPLTLTLCYINKAEKKVGAIAALTSNLKLEVPSLKKKLEIKGSAIGSVSPINVKQTTGTVTFTQTAGVQGIEKCEGEAARKLETSENGGTTFVQSGQEVTTEVTFSTATEVMA